MDKGKSILITGASRGIGYAIAERLAPGNLIYAHYHQSKKEVNSLAKSIESNGGECILIQADLAVAEEVNKLIEAVKSHSNQLDVLINNAATLPKNSGNPHQFSWQTLEKTFAINVFSLMSLSMLCKPLLLNGTNPCVINMSSIAARAGGASLLYKSYLELMIYGASKGAVDTFTRGLAKMFAPNIRVNSIAPGMVDTGIHEAYFAEGATDQTMAQFVESAKSATPLQRNGTTDDVMTVVTMLLQNQYITGECIDVNGGLFMR